MRALLVLVFTVILLTGNSQPYFQVKHISVSDGLSNGRVYDIERDSLGYMWCATANGLTRFSGMSLKKYWFDLDQVASDPSVMKLIHFQGYFLAVFKSGQIFQYDYKGDRWEQKLNLPGETLTTLSGLDDQLLIIGTIDGFYLYDFQTSQVSEKKHQNLTFIRRIEQVGSTIYLSTSKGLHRMVRNEDGDLSSIEILLKGIDILDFEIDPNGAIWIGTENNGLYRLKDGQVNKVNFTSENQLSVRDIAIDKQGDVLIAVDRKGFFITDRLGHLKAEVSYDPDGENALSQNSITTMFVDDQDGIWLGIGEIGLNVLYRQSNRFINIFHQRYSSNTINNDAIRSIYQDNYGNLWFGTEDGLSRRDLQGNWENFNVGQKGAILPVLSIAYYRNKMLLGTYGEGVIEFKNGTTRPSNLKSLKRVFATYVDDDYLWVGGNDGPVHQYLGDSLVATYRTGQVKTFSKKDHRTMLVGTVEGVYQIDTETRTVEKSTFNNSLVSNIYSLYFDPKSQVLWIANDNGLSRYDYRTNTYNQIGVLSDASGAVYSVLQYGENELWVAAEKGLFKYKIREDWFRKYGKEDALTVEEFGFGAGSKLMDGRFAFCGPNGAVLFDPYQIEVDNSEPKIFVSDLFINGSLVDDLGFGRVNFSENIELLHNQNTLRFNIDYLKMHGSKDFVLNWKLDGFDDQEQMANNQQSIVYRNLSPGKYELRASVVSADGVQSSNEVFLNIKIKQPIWLKWWAFVIYAVIVFLLTYAARSVIISRHERKISDEKIKFFIDVAHDIRTPVSLIRLASDQILKRQNVEESVQVINRYTRNLNEYVTELLDFQKSERKMLTILATSFNLSELIKSTIQDFHIMIEQKEIELNVDVPDDLTIWGDKVQVGRVLTNLVSNAIKYNRDKGSINLYVERTETNTKVFIKDTGVGIPDNQIDKIFERFHRASNALVNEVRGTGIGLVLSKRIIDLHKGSLTCTSEESKGSTFCMEMLNGKNHFALNELKLEDNSEGIARLTESNIKGKKSILVIEDNPDILSYIEKSLSTDYFVITSNNGKEGLFKFFDQKPDMVISDVMLPGMNGKEICHMIKYDSHFRQTPVILITALAGADDKVAGLEVGADYYLEKPFDIQVLILAVKNLLKRKQLNQEIEPSQSNRGVESPEENLLSSVIAIINGNISNHEFSIDELCEKVGLSRSNLFRKVKSISGLSPSDLIQEIKMNKAKELLNSELHARIDNVAYKTGFNDPRYFSTLFKKHFGMTPTEYQAKQRA
ncbi:hybrid sensor histidine kinase/response regulator transcription factor [Marinoscillum sp. MHG1-6]|uniref:hybrid sensor histidine kinase/response regulator transcription factor n=1 Tax=Marinoscillum sp. MHG1-6 TaxID=2959627 RepID=UPI0021582992|nr:hybrid sensor histidine kinase/response regulator transcription factor [Marinoscillum sp. MHG1-6]